MVNNQGVCIFSLFHPYTHIQSNALTAPQISLKLRQLFLTTWSKLTGTYTNTFMCQFLNIVAAVLLSVQSQRPVLVRNPTLSPKVNIALDLSKRIDEVLLIECMRP